MSKRKVVVIVQARMGSTRLPGKMLLWFQGYPIIEWIRLRLSQCQEVDKVVFALPDTSVDKPLWDYLVGQGAEVYLGSEKDVLSRFYSAAISYNAEDVVRVCADNPFVCPREVDYLIERFRDHRCDYMYNHIPKDNQYPDGLGAEIVSIDLLRRLHEEAETEEQREHIFNYIHDNPGLFSVATFDPGDVQMWNPDLKLDLDTLDDYVKLSSIALSPDMQSVEIVDKFRKVKDEAKKSH